MWPLKKYFFLRLFAVLLLCGDTVTFSKFFVAWCKLTPPPYYGSSFNLPSFRSNREFVYQPVRVSGGDDSGGAAGRTRTCRLHARQEHHRPLLHNRGVHR